MDESVSSLSDLRIASLITTSITDMVRQEVGKIMQELDMPVCTDAIDRIIAENLDKEVEKQNVVRTYKRKLNKVNQYKCIEKCAESDEVVISSLQLIENRVKKLEDFVLENLMQRPQLMQDLAVRSRENLVRTREHQKDCVKGSKARLQKHSAQTEDQNETRASKLPTLLNLDDFIRVIKECPETQDSFDIFQSAAERIKHDLERFIQECKSDLCEKTACERGNRENERERIASSERKNIKPNDMDSSKNMTVKKSAIKPEELIESTESVTVVKTGFADSNALPSFDRPTDSDDMISTRKTSKNKALPGMVRLTIGDNEESATTETAIDLQTESGEVENKVKNTKGESAIDVAPHLLVKSMSGGDKQEIEFNEEKSVKTILPQQSMRDSKTSQIPQLERECTKCKECLQRNHHMQRERSKPYVIDDDIKWKLNRILDHIGDFCSRSRGGEEFNSEPDRRSLSIKAASAYQPQAQPGTSAEFNKRKFTRSGSMSRTPKQLQQVVIRSCALSPKCERHNPDRILEQIRKMQHYHLQQKQEALINNVPFKSVATNIDPTAKNKAHKSMEHTRHSVDAFKIKKSIEYNKKSLAKTTARIPTMKATKLERIRSTGPKSSSIPIRTNTETIPKTAMKKRPVERCLPPPKARASLPLSHHERELKRSSTDLMLESIDCLARTAAATKARMSRASHVHDDFHYSRRHSIHAPTVNLSEIRRTKVLYHNYSNFK